MAYPVGEDIKRLEELLSGLAKFAGAASTLLLVLAVWVRTTYLQVDPGKVVGFAGVTGLNVGHAIVFGPVLAFVVLAVNYDKLGKIAVLEEAIRNRIKHIPGLKDDLTDSNRLTLGLLDGRHGFGLSSLAGRLTKTFWYVIVPLLCNLVLLRRFFDFIPPAEANNPWTLSGKLALHLFSTRAWEIRPIIADKFIEKPEIADFLPYIYSPLQAWAYLILTLAGLGIAGCSARLLWKVE
ncbi:hypothetical protein BH10PSE7_BH10PSE7_23720 [soil metagenome]